MLATYLALLSPIKKMQSQHIKNKLKLKKDTSNSVLGLSINPRESSSHPRRLIEGHVGGCSLVFPSDGMQMDSCGESVPGRVGMQDRKNHTAVGSKGLDTIATWVNLKDILLSEKRTT